MTLLAAGPLTDLLELAGTFAFALSGAISGARRGMDIFGVIVLAFVTAVAGGIVRDVLIGSLPPDAFRTWHGLALATLAGMLVFWVGKPLTSVRSLMLLADAVGLAVFAVTGASKALSHGLIPAMAAVLGMISAVGGGMVRDMLAAQIPMVLTSDIYAVAALLGAAIVAVGPALHIPSDMTVLFGAAICLLLRLIAARRGWKLPVAVMAGRPVYSENRTHPGCEQGE